MNADITSPEGGRLESELKRVRDEYGEVKRKNLKLDMSRGKPGADQLELSAGMLEFPKNPGDFIYDGADTRNYGMIEGLPSMRNLFAQMLGVKPAQVLAGNNSSLELMYNAVARAMTHGVLGSPKPWGKEEKVKFLCPVPGYDRHFSICRHFGIEMINVEMKPDGPDMDAVEGLAGSDPAVKGIWCVPKFSNPDGAVYSDGVIERFAALKPAAPDFRIFWDNAYCVHSLEPASDRPIPDILSACEKSGRPDMAFVFASTSKISYSGAGVAAMAASEENLAFIKKQLSIQTIGPDKLNQLRHAVFFKNLDGLIRHMERHAAILRRKFGMVLSILERELGGTGAGEWTNPKGGYFISLNTPDGTAKRAVSLAAEAGVVMTPAGATFPYDRDPRDRNIRIAPTFPPLNELEQAMEVICLSVLLAALEKIAGC